MSAQHALEKKRTPDLSLIEGDGSERYQDGWRAGKPIEDPDKLKRWGFITAKPSEYLIVVQRGQINRRASGQGARIFKWPWESVAIVPTTLQRVEFVADQITLERIGVRVTGIAVFRIADPEIAYRVLNFTYGERAGEKLQKTLREMFIGAARRLIANLSLDDCLQKRKEAIAGFLMKEIAPVVGGTGDPDDVTAQGWGVVIDTIEIQDVHIQSEKVFENLQAEFRAEIETKAKMAKLEQEKEVAERRAETEKEIAEATIETSRATRMLKAKAEAEAAQTESEETLKAEQAKAKVKADELSRRESIERRRLEVEEVLSLRQQESQAKVEKEKSEFERRREIAQIESAKEKRCGAADAEMSAREAEEELAKASHEQESQKLERDRAQKTYAQQTEIALREKEKQNGAQLRRLEAELKRLEMQVENEKRRADADVEQMLSQGKVMQSLVTSGLPAIASAFSQSYGTINYTQLGGGEGENPMNMAASLFGQVMTVARGFGLDPAKLQSDEVDHKESE
jgi:flotillin